MIILLLITLLLMSSCYNQGQQTPDAWDLAGQELDSISYNTTHHYTLNYNFIVKADTLAIIEQHPAELLSDMVVDTLSLKKGDQIVVAGVTVLPSDTIDSVWVKVARDELTIGWLHERDMLPAVKPNDPISQFIDFFSDTYRLAFLAIIVLVGVAYILRKLHRHNSYIVHFRDIESPYPALLAVLVATAATLYSSIQLFGAESWRHFYYHPSLNPFSVPVHIGIFLLTVWAIVVVAIAVIDDTRRRLPLAEAILYWLGLTAVCAFNYIVFSFTTLYYVGYVLLVAYYIFAFRTYFRNYRSRYLCGKCGMKMYNKGECPRCGTLND